MSIRENIAYGDNSRTDIPLKEIIEVAKQTNIHDFIRTLAEVCYWFILTEKKIFARKSEERRLVEQNGLTWGERKTPAVDKFLTADDLDAKKSILVRKGKKKFYRLIRE